MFRNNAYKVNQCISPFTLMPDTSEKRAEVLNELHRLEVELNDAQVQTLFAFLASNPTCTVPTALRFCYARKFDLARTQTLFNNYKGAVEKNGLSGTTVNDVLQELRTAKLYCPGGRDRDGAGLFVICARNHVSKTFSLESTQKLAFYLAELVTSHPKTQRNGLTLICDLDGVEWSQFDSAFMQKITNFFQNNVPCSIKHILFYKPPWWVNMLITMMTPFLKQKMRQRIKTCKTVKELEEIVDKDQLPEQLGGKMQYDHDFFIRSELSKVSRVFVSKGTQTRKEREEAGRMLVAPPKDTTYLVESKTVRDILMNERDMRLKVVEAQLKGVGKVEEVLPPIPNIPRILSMMRNPETRHLLSSSEIMYCFNNPVADLEQMAKLNKQRSKSTASPSVSVEKIPEERGRDELPMTVIEGESTRKYSRRVSQGMQVTPSVDFKAEALKLDRQRRSCKPVML